jgi:hypothetical protein
MKQKTMVPAILPLVSRPAAALNQRREASSPRQVIELSVVVAKGTEPAVALTAGERGELDECEGIIEQGLSIVFEVGMALLRIRESRLYRDSHPTFEQYCHDRWNIGRSYAWRVMGAAERLKLLPGDDHLPRPENEFQMRPFLKLAPEEFPGAWKRAVKTAKEGKVTTRIVHAVIRELVPNNKNQVRAGKKGKQGKGKAKWPEGQVLTLLNEAKRQVQKGETDKALAALDTIEGLLFRA